ncbi:MAG TPA: hypothetical protein VE891_12820 [Allosphingosinicella sp.]|nr:hypothetical protein [Allosphingosinicella sp.]
MSQDALPTQYYLEIYTGTTDRDPFFSIKSTTPFLSISVGDYIEPKSFDSFPLKLAEGAAVKVSSIEHIFWTISDSHHGHKLIVEIEVTPTKSSYTLDNL